MKNLTEREKQIVSRVLQGKVNRVIAQELGLTEGTIKGRLHRIYLKLEVKNRLELRHHHAHK